MAYRVNIAQWNANAIRAKTQEVIAFMSKHKIDIMAIAETKLKNTDKIKFKNFNTERQDAFHAAGGRFAIN